MRTISACLLASVFSSILLVSSAHATTISGTYSVTGSNFTSTSASPFASINESFNITFNNAVTASQQTSGITLNASTITPTSPLAYTYISGLDTLIVGGTAATVATSDPASTDFTLVINNASNVNNFQVTSLSYSVGTGAVYTALTTGRSPAVAAVTPEPSTISLLGTGLLGVIGAVRRKRLA